MKTYQETKDLLKSLAGEYVWGEDSDLLFAKQKALLDIFRHGLDVFGTKYGAFNTSDRGVALVQFNYKDVFDGDTPKGFVVSVSLIEDGLAYGCPKAVAKVITDTQAQGYITENKAHIENLPPIGERKRDENFVVPEFGEFEESIKADAVTI